MILGGEGGLTWSWLCRIASGVSSGGRGKDFLIRLSVDGVFRCADRFGDGGTIFCGGVIIFGDGRFEC